MAKPKSDSEKSFQPDWKSIGIGVIAGALLLTLILAAGGRVEEWNFGVVKLSIPTSTSNTVQSSPTDKSERSIHSYPVTVFNYDGMNDDNVKQGYAELSISYVNQEPHYFFDYYVPSDGTYGYAGLVFRFDPPQDLSAYQTIRVVLEYLDDASLCELYINDITSKGEFYLLGKNNLPGGVVRINGSEYSYDIALSNFKKPNFKVIYEIGLSVDQDITSGAHRIVLKDISFLP